MYETCENPVFCKSAGFEPESLIEEQILEKNLILKVMKHYLTLDLKNNRKLIGEYKRWHQPENIWKEIPKGIKEIGILEMEIFLFQNRLMMVVETPDNFNWNEQMGKLSKLPLQEEWEALMDAFQQRLPDTIGKWQRMERIFKLSDCE